MDWSIKLNDTFMVFMFNWQLGTHFTPLNNAKPKCYLNTLTLPVVGTVSLHRGENAVWT